MTGSQRVAMVKRLKVKARSTHPREGLNLPIATQAIGGSVVGTIVRGQIYQLIITAGTVVAIMAQGGIIGITLYLMLNLSLSVMRATAQHGVEGVAGVETGSLGDLVPTMPLEAVAGDVRQGEVVAKGINS